MIPSPRQPVQPPLNQNRMPAGHCFRLDEEPEHLRPQYRRIALVNSRDHADVIGGDPDTLIVSGNWLLWQQLRRDGRPALLAGRGISGLDNLRGLGETYLLAVNDWHIVDGQDVTRFSGVSLGEKFTALVAPAVMDYEIKKQPLELFIRRFRPSEIVYFEYRTDSDFLNEKETFRIAQQLADEFGLSIDDRRDSRAPETTDFSTLRHYDSGREKRQSIAAAAKSALLKLVDATLAQLSLWRSAFRPAREKILVIATSMISIPLIRRANDANTALVFLARWFPHKRRIGFLFQALKNGVILIDASKAPLSRQDTEAVEQIVNRLEAAWRTPSSGRDEVLRRFARKAILDRRLFHAAAAETRWVESVLDRCLPAQILTDSIKNATTTTFLEVAKQRRIVTNLTWHGIIVQDFRFRLLGCGSGKPSLVDRCLTWGVNHERWLKNIRAEATTARIGGIVAHGLPSSAKHSVAWRNVLVLQYVTPLHDFQAPSSHEYLFFVETLRTLEKLGYESVRFRFHPGIEKVGYYRDIAEQFGLSYPATGGGLFHEQLEWADLVIGPATSGAMLETIAAGKPYYPVMLNPHASNMTYFGEGRVFSSVEELESALRERTPLDQRNILRDFYSGGEVADPVAQTFKVLAELPLSSHPGAAVPVP